MKQTIILFFTALIISACSTESAMQLGNNRMQIDVSAAPVYGRAGAQRIAYEKAAEATLEAGYDKFIVLKADGWNEKTGWGASSSSGGYYSSGWGTQRNPESKMIIEMFHYGDRGAKKAVDARSVLGIDRVEIEQLETAAEEAKASEMAAEEQKLEDGTLTKEEARRRAFRLDEKENEPDIYIQY